MAGYVDQIIMLCVGLYATSVGFGWLSLPVKSGPAEARHEHFRRISKILGPLLIVCALLLALGQYARGAQGPG